MIIILAWLDLFSGQTFSGQEAREHSVEIPGFWRYSFLNHQGRSQFFFFVKRECMSYWYYKREFNNTVRPEQ